MTGLQILEKNICEGIKDELDKVGFLYRLFSRVKDDKSIHNKIERKIELGKPYCIGGKLMQDIIGVRIVTYFMDDINLVMEILRDKFDFVDSEIDSHDPTVFKPKRTNIICGLNERQRDILREVKVASLKEHYSLVDNTFELQLRTILSEGWHEIDHSLRYKSTKDWSLHPENERQLNGIYASLETNDIALKNLFNELAYKHFKNQNWEGLIKNKFRLRFQESTLNETLLNVLNTDPGIGKALYKLEREKLLLMIYKSEISFPINVNTLVYLANGLLLKNEKIFNVTPDPIVAIFKETKV